MEIILKLNYCLLPRGTLLKSQYWKGAAFNPMKEGAPVGRVRKSLFILHTYGSSFILWLIWPTDKSTRHGLARLAWPGLAWRAGGWQKNIREFQADDGPKWRLPGPASRHGCKKIASLIPSRFQGAVIARRKEKGSTRKNEVVLRWTKAGFEAARTHDVASIWGQEVEASR